METTQSPIKSSFFTAHVRLTLTHRQEGKTKPVRTRFYPGSYSGERGNFLTLFDMYYARHKTAEAAALPA